VLELYHRSPLEPNLDWTTFLEALAGQAAIAIDNAALFRDLQQSHAGLIAAYDGTIEGWARALDLRDKETEGHTRHVTEMTVKLARFMDVDELELLAIRRGSLLHNIGKLGIPDAILLKPGKLTEEEWKIMRRHPEYAFEWLAVIPTLRPALDIPYCHHEKWDGTGYPRGLRGEQIPLAARMFAAVDIWDALRSDRPYRAAWPESRVLEHIRSLSATHLDPTVVEAFLRLMHSDDSRFRLSVNGRCCVRTDLPAEITTEARAADLEGRLERAAESLRQSEARCDEQVIEISRLSQLSLTDDLTGLNNRRHFHEALDAAFSLAGRLGQPLSVLMLDIDLFKSYNDEHGHPAGDDVLRILSETIRGEIRPHDLIARHGGEEFVALLPGADADGGRAVAERLRVAIADHGWPLRQITASFGIATTPPDVPAAADLIEAADIALYVSKQRGRDRVTHREDLEVLGTDAPHLGI
jgi:diguanylate cyclase (GGDEF)-like protein